MGLSMSILPDGTLRIGIGESLRSRQHAPARHSRARGHVSTERWAATCGIVGVSAERALSCPRTPNVDWTLALRPRWQGSGTGNFPPNATGGDAFPARSFFRADRADYQSREESNDGTHETKPAQLRRRRMGRNRVRVFPHPKTGLYQIEWRENGRRLTRSLGHRDWTQAKRQADEFATSFVGPDLNGKAEAEPEPLTLGTRFDIYGEEVTPTRGKRTRERDRVKARCSCGSSDRTATPPPSPSATGTDSSKRGGPIRETCRQSDDRVEPDVPHGGLQLGREVEGRAGPPAARQEPAEGPQEAQGEEPRPGFRGRSVGGSTSPSCSRTRPGIASEPSASSGGPISTTRAVRCGGGRNTRRSGTSTGRR